MNGHETDALLAALVLLALTFTATSLVLNLLAERRRDRDAAYRRMLDGRWHR